MQALGFAITAEQLEQAMEVADLVWDNTALRADITLFARDYVKAQHALELTNLSGAATFEVLFTITLAAVTAGAGLAVGAASQARHLAKFRKVGKLLMEFAEQIKKVRQRLRRGTASGNNGPSRSLNDLPVDEVLVDKSPVDGPSHPDRVREPTGTQNKSSANPKTRLPRENGRWEGEPGNGLWHSNIDEVNEITDGKPIEFVNGSPMFTSWAKGRLSLNQDNWMEEIRSSQ